MTHQRCPCANGELAFTVVTILLLFLNTQLDSLVQAEEEGIPERVMGLKLAVLKHPTTANVKV